MKKTISLAGILLGAILLTALATIDETFVGDLLEIDDEYIIVERENEDGSLDSMTFAIDEKTTFFDGEEECTIEDLEEFDLVKVDYRTAGEQNIATTVTIMPEEEGSEEPAR